MTMTKTKIFREHTETVDAPLKKEGESAPSRRGVFERFTVGAGRPSSWESGSQWVAAHRFDQGGHFLGCIIIA